MGLATDGQWKGPLNGESVDGTDMWEAITTNDKSAQRQEIVFFSNGDACALQWESYRYLYEMKAASASEPEWVFSELEGESYLQCTAPSLMSEEGILQQFINFAIFNIPITGSHLVTLTIGFFVAFVVTLYSLYFILNRRNNHKLSQLNVLAPSNSSPYAPLA